MIITKMVTSDIVTLSLEGNMDAQDSVQLSDELESILSEKEFNIHLEMMDLNYISSSGLRVLLAMQKKALAIGKSIEIFNANETIKKVFTITGFSNLIKIR